MIVGFRAQDSDDEEEQFESVPGRAAQAPPPADVAPRFCQRHFTSAQREKIDPLMRPCQKCGTQITSTYASMTLCPPCSNTEESCMICGDHAPVASNYVPPKTLNPQSGPSGPPGGAVYAMPDPGAKRGSTLPPPPPPSASHSPSRRMSDDWRMGLGSPNSQPPPPPPPSRGRTGVSHSDHREHRARDTARPAPRENLGPYFTTDLLEMFGFCADKHTVCHKPIQLRYSMCSRSIKPVSDSLQHIGGRMS